jgi:hypothetical protein
VELAVKFGGIAVGHPGEIADRQIGLHPRRSGGKALPRAGRAR